MGLGRQGLEVASFMGQAPEHAMPIQPRQHLGFEQPHAPTFLGGIHQKGADRLLAVVKLRHHHTVVARDQRTHGVAVVVGVEGAPLQVGEHVAGRHVSQGKHIGVAGMLRGEAVGGGPASRSFTGQGAGGDHFRRTHRRHRVEHGEGQFFVVFVAVRIPSTAR